MSDSPPSSSQRVRRMSILHRAVGHALLLTTIVVATLSVTAFVVARALMQQRVLSQISLAASAGEDFLQEAMSTARERAALVAGLHQVREMLELPATSVGQSNQWEQTLRETQQGLIGIGVFQRDGTLRAGTGSIGTVMLHMPGKVEVVPFIGTHGWEWYDVLAPVRDAAGRTLGAVALRYDAAGFLPSFDIALSSLGETATVHLAIPRDADIVSLRRDRGGDDAPRWNIARTGEPTRALLERAIAGEEGVLNVPDVDEEHTLIAYRNIPSLGWAVAVGLREDEALAGVHRLGLTLCAIGIMLFLLAVLLGSLLARQLTGPLRSLMKKVQSLGPGHWGVERTVRTGDEVEVLDIVIASMADRLRTTYLHLEEEVRARTAQFKEQYALDRAILDGVDYGVMTVDADAKVTSVNPAGIRMLEADAAALVGRAIEEALPLCFGRECTPMTEHLVHQCLQQRSVERPDARAHISIARANGPLPIDVLVSPLLEGGRLLGAVILFQDVSEGRRIDEMKSEFISLASHQLRTPISILNWYMELLAGDENVLGADQREYLREMRIAASRMSGLLNALLQVARLEGESVSMNTADVDVQALLKEIARDAASMAEPKGISCVVASSASSIVVKTDEALLKVVLQNLVTNAVKYGKKGGQLRLAAEQSHNVVRCTIADDGVGIPAAEQAHIFEKFFRAKNVKQFDTDGNGLGLYMSKMIMDGLGGQISFTSKEGKGATFVVEIPMQTGNTQRMAAPASQPKKAVARKKKVAKRNATKKGGT